MTVRSVTLDVSEVPRYGISGERGRALGGRTLITVLRRPRGAGVKLHGHIVVVLLCSSTVEVSRLLDLALGSLSLRATGPCVEVSKGKGGRHIMTVALGAMRRLGRCLSVFRGGRVGLSGCMFCAAVGKGASGVSPKGVRQFVGGCTGDTEVGYVRIPLGMCPRVFEEAETASLCRGNMRLRLVSEVLKRSSARAAGRCTGPSVRVLEGTVRSMRAVRRTSRRPL